MTDGDVVRPFRWDVRRRSELGSLADVELPDRYAEFEDDLLDCAARVLAFAGDSDLVFVGRSPHAVYDLLSGLLLDTSWTGRLRLLNVALRLDSPTVEQRRLLRPYLAEVGLEPSVLVRNERPAALTDVVDTGWTFERLVQILAEWAREEHVTWRTVARKLRIVGITWREKTSPKTWRWQQHAEWPEAPARWDQERLGSTSTRHVPRGGGAEDEQVVSSR